MSQQLVTCLIAVGANLIGMMVVYAAMSGAVAHRRTLAVIALILISQLFWIVPASWIVETRWIAHASAYALWLGNWLVCGFGIVLFWKSARGIPVSLIETARMDGLGGFAAWRQTVLPFVRCDLLILAALTVMATLLPSWSCVADPEAGGSIALFERFLSPSGRLAFMAAISIVGAIPLLTILFAVKNGGTTAAPSQSS